MSDVRPDGIGGAPGPNEDGDTWELEYRSRRLATIAGLVAGVVIIIHVIFGLLLTISNTGPANIGADDQAAIICIGLVEAGAAMMLMRPRLRVGRP